MSNNKRVLKRNVKRTAWFLGIYFVFALFLCALLIVVGIPQWLNMMIIVIAAGIFYLLFWLCCVKIDKRREEKMQGKTKDFDPFAD